MCLAIYGALGSGAPLDFSLNFASPIGLGEGGGSRARERRRRRLAAKEGEQGKQAPRRAVSSCCWGCGALGSSRVECGSVAGHPLFLFAGLDPTGFCFLADRSRPARWRPRDVALLEPWRASDSDPVAAGGLGLTMGPDRVKAAVFRSPWFAFVKASPSSSSLRK
jgi:hypothetical protein